MVVQGTNLAVLSVASFALQIWVARDINKIYLNYLGEHPEIVEKKFKKKGEIKSAESAPTTMQINFKQENDFLVEEPIIAPTLKASTSQSSFAPLETVTSDKVAKNEVVEQEKSSPAKTSEPIDINNASLESLVSSLDVSAETLRKIVNIRDQIGAFSSYEHLFKRADVRPHEMIKLRGRLTFGLIAGDKEGEVKAGESSQHRIVDL
jgi:DNA uptake protein ComE-like DNA-binding protein